MRLKIGLDIDDTICDFIGPYLKRFGTPKRDSEITKNVSRILINDKDFWMNLPIIHSPTSFLPCIALRGCIQRTWPRQFRERITSSSNISNSLPAF